MQNDDDAPVHVLTVDGRMPLGVARPAAAAAGAFVVLAAMPGRVLTHRLDRRWAGPARPVTPRDARQ